MKRLFSLITTGLIFFYSNSFSCSCIYWGGTFCETMTVYDHLSSSDFIITRCVKLNDTLHGMMVKNLDVIYGEEERDNFIVWGDETGMSCRGFTNGYSTNDTLILGIIRMGYYSPDSTEKAGDYVISFCGRYSLSYSNGVVTGFISEHTSEMPYPNFKDYIQNGSYTEQCTVEVVQEIPKFNITPNPVNSNLEITIPYEWMDIQIFNTLGQLVLQSSNQQSDDYNVQLNVSDFRKGVYYLSIVTDGGTIHISRFVKL